nr:hypothetical protein [uncultured Brevundimonas sp.]
MTPLLERTVDRLASAGGDECMMLGGLPREAALGMISAAQVFVIDDADADTTLARQLQPGYFATTTGFYLPSPVCWYEYKACVPVGGALVDTGHRAAFLASSDDTDGISVLMIAEIPVPPGLMIRPGFMLDKELERRPVVVEGQPIAVRYGEDIANYGCPNSMQTGVNFFLELVEMVNMPVGVHRREEVASRNFRRRLVRAMGRTDFDLQTVTHISLDPSDLAARGVVGAA